MNDPDPHELRMRRSLELVVSDAAGKGLTPRQIQNSLVEYLAQVTVATAVTPKELDDATEVVRHQLDQRLAYYDRLASNPHTD